MNFENRYRMTALRGAYFLPPRLGLPDLNPQLEIEYWPCCTHSYARMLLQDKIEANAASRLQLPPGRMPGQELARYKAFLKVETHRVKLLHRAGEGGHPVCQARATILDVLLRYLWDAAKQ